MTRHDTTRREKESSTAEIIMETLVWSRWQMAKDLEFAPDAKLLGPALHTSVWDFDDWNEYNVLL
jgi:hypothetical protein